MENVISPPYLSTESISPQSVTASTETTEEKHADSPPTTEEKRDIIKHQLKNNFPVKTVLTFGVAFISLGVAAISLDVALITFKAVNYQLGNGVWAGCSAILNGLTKMNQCKFVFIFYFIKFKNLKTTKKKEKKFLSLLVFCFLFVSF